jgi:hypothetical protein
MSTQMTDVQQNSPTTVPKTCEIHNVGKAWEYDRSHLDLICNWNATFPHSRFWTMLMLSLQKAIQSWVWSFSDNLQQNLQQCSFSVTILTGVVIRFGR